MSATLLGLLCAAMSALCLAMLAASDPKRLGKRSSALRSLRALAVAVAVVPGALFAVTGRWVAFLIWLGTVAVLGWMIAAGFSAFSSRAGLRLETTPAELKETRDEQ
jgi:hypothetical protein